MTTTVTSQPKIDYTHVEVLPVHFDDLDWASRMSRRTAPHQHLIIGDEKRGSRPPSLDGHRARTAYPPPGAGPAANTPPYRVARSRVPARP